ncbi:Nicotinate-nucleotide--dimethylbenzimidazole phosphoribosyltransferase [hydrothermal vent metagenome]|uniref:Nicotinate-nucleotide--dimethylbenzimidazole phosphoribosyltransferase n=1 Tax=hydrothermal vent metagenome TaxID=652676 RepID=A0A3B1AG36_9ZZZZ
MKEQINNPIAELDQSYYDLACSRQSQLTKPLGSLGTLEDIAIKFCVWQKTLSPVIKNPVIVIFAADHGIANENVSAFPQAVTTEMIRNFSNGGAAISVLAKSLKIPLQVIDVGTVVEAENLDGVISKRIAAGTKNFAVEPAMSLDECYQAMSVGEQLIKQEKKNALDVFIAGEMGIANTSSASAISSVLLNLPAEKLTGPGTGLDQKSIIHKANIIQTAIEFHQSNFTNDDGTIDVLRVLQTVGGFEIAALVGAYLTCAQQGIPILVDGFICSVAALVATRIAPKAINWMCFSHKSLEPGHQLVLDALTATPILSLNMRLGEASGAALSIATIKLALELHNNMATFEQAAVSNKK